MGLERGRAKLFNLALGCGIEGSGDLGLGFVSPVAKKKMRRGLEGWSGARRRRRQKFEEAGRKAAR
jgi:hypothetical protein